MLLEIIEVFRDILLAVIQSAINTGSKILSLFFQIAEIFRSGMGSASPFELFLSAGLVVCVFLLVIHFVWGSIKTILLIILLLVLLFMLLVVIL
jgi:Flp pilus assembly protein TadB